MRIVRRENEWILLRNKVGEFSLERVAFETGYRVSQIADRMGIGGRHLQELFLRDIGIPPKQCLKNQRMVAAKKMLIGGRRSPEVARLLGFASPSNFAREFALANGKSPGVFLSELFLQGWMRESTDHET